MYDLLVDLTGDGGTFASRAEIRFRCQRAGNSAFADLQAVSVRRADGQRAGRVPAPRRWRGRWEFAATHPIAPYLSSFCAGPFSGPAFTWEAGLVASGRT